jgi:hypothetical protein
MYISVKKVFAIEYLQIKAEVTGCIMKSFQQNVDRSTL